MNLQPNFGPDTLFTPPQTAEMLGVSVQTLASWRHYKNTTLVHTFVGRSIRYRYADIVDYIRSNSSAQGVS